MTIASEITRINTNIANAYTACDNKGATMPAIQNSANLATCIGSIPSGTTPTGTLSITANGIYDVTNYASADVNVSGGGDIPEWQPDPDWWDIKTILENDIRDYTGKAIILYSNSDDFTTLTLSSPTVAVATSDGSFYTSTTTHTWDRSKDKIVTSDTSDTTPKYGTRYLILYFNTSSPDYTALTNFRNGSIYAVFKCNLSKLLSTDAVSNNTFFYNNRTLQSFDFLTGYNLSFGTNFSSFCYNCYSLTKLPDNLDTSSGTNFSTFCSACNSLVKLPDNLDTSSGKNFDNFCSACYSLVKANIKLANVSVTTLSSPTFIDIQSLEYIANNAPTATGTKTLTIGSTNITRAGGASGTIISTLTNKGWTVN